MDTRQSVAGVAGLSTMFALIVSLLHALTPVAPPIPQAAPQAKAAAPAAKAKKRATTAQPVDSHVVVTGRDLLNEFYGTIDSGPPHAQQGKPKQIADSYQR